jgi:GNAT superfamily N-acetyltransferase
MSEIDVRTIDASERDAVLDLLAGWLNDRGFFARYFQHDPTFRDDLCLVAADGARIMSCLQVFRKAVRVGDAVLDVGGVGNVYTDPAYRGRGLASALLRQAIGAMGGHGFDVSLLFATRLAFYGQFGWQSYARHLTFIAPGAAAMSGQWQIEPFEADRDLDEVMRLYDRHCAAVSGTTVRDPRYWLGQLRYAGNPDETFLVARAGGRIVAYARSTTLYDFHTIIEHACLPGSGDALADLLCALHGAAAHLPGTVAQLSCEEGLEDTLRRRGLSLRTVEDVFWMWRLIDPARVAAKLRLPVAATGDPDFCVLSASVHARRRAPE